MIYVINSILIIVVWICCSKAICLSDSKLCISQGPVKSEVVFSLLMTALMGGVVGLRNNVGADFKNYKQIYMHYATGSGYTVQLGRIEPGYKFLNILIGKTGAPFWVFNLIIALLTISFLMAALYAMSSNIYLSTYLYVCFFYLYFDMNQVRQGLAMTMGLFALSQLYRNRKILFWVFLLLAVSIQYVIILFAILYFLRKVKISKKIILLYSICAVIAYFGVGLITRLLSHTIYGFYLEKDYSYYNTASQRTLLLNLTIRIVMLIISLCFYKSYEKELFANVFIHMAFICTILQVLTVNMPIAGRTTTPFFLSYIFIVPLIMKCFSYEDRILINGGVVVIASFYQYVYYLGSGSAVLVNSYSTIFG